jgi:hypothetical protein
VQSFKDYDNGTRISYVKIIGISDKSQADYITREILKNPVILKFSVYEKENISNLIMVESESSIEDIQIQSLMNDAIVKYKEVEIARQEILVEMPTYTDTGNPEYDNEIFKKKKDEWIKNNPEKYKKLNELNRISDNENLEKQLKEQIQK